MVCGRCIGAIWWAVLAGIWLGCGGQVAGASDGWNAGGYQRYRLRPNPTRPIPQFSHDTGMGAVYHGPNAAMGRWPSAEGHWFQRPYPYHLDYYRWRYQGSYAPYFGNLYGPPHYSVPPVLVGPSAYGGSYGGTWHW